MSWRPSHTHKQQVHSHTVPRDKKRLIQSEHTPNFLILTDADSSLHNGKGLKRSLSNTKTETTNQAGAPPEYLLPGSSERPLMALLPQTSQPEVHTSILFDTRQAYDAKRLTDSVTSFLFPQAPTYLKDLSLSCWNPPPGHRKLQGDFLYINVVTVEGRQCDITSCPKGFFLNR